MALLFSKTWGPQIHIKLDHLSMSNDLTFRMNLQYLNVYCHFRLFKRYIIKIKIMKHGRKISFNEKDEHLLVDAFKKLADTGLYYHCIK